MPQHLTRGPLVNPIRLVSGAIALPAHAAAAAIGASVGVATTGVRTTARVVGWVLERRSGPTRVAPAPWTGDRASSTTVDPVSATRTATRQAPTTQQAAAPTLVAQAPAKKAPAKKAPAKKAPVKKASSKQAAVLAPALGLSEAEVEAELGLDDSPTTPSGIPAAGRGINPDTTETDLHQPGTEPLMDPAMVKAVVSESEVLRRGADTDKG